MTADTALRCVRPVRISATGGDIALLASALFLQRFSLAFGNSLMSLDIVPAAFILIHQFVSGRLLIQYDRLLWFLAAGMAATCSLWFNFSSTMLPSYCLFIVVYALLTLIRPCSKDRYRRTLLGFQSLAAVLSLLAVAQFLAQFVLDGKELIRFYGVVPDFLFASFETSRANTIIPLAEGSSLIKSNGIFLTEPSTMSQIAALAILIEILEFRRPRYLLLFALGLLLSYSGTGILILLLFLPLAGIGRRVALPILLVALFAFGLLGSGIIDSSIFFTRIGEFNETRTSGFQRFISPFWLAAEHINTAPLRVLLIGNGPGTTDDFVARFWVWYSTSAGTWIKLFYEYGLIGSFVFICFLISCVRRTLCSRILLGAMLFYYIFLGGLLLTTPFLILMIVLCTLSVPETGHTMKRYRRSIAAESTAG